MRTQLFCLLMPVFFIAGKANAQMIMTANAPDNSYATTGNDNRMAPPGNNAANVKTYPNPVMDYLVISFQYPITKHTTADVSDASGRSKMRYVLGKGGTEYKIDMREHANGVYFLRLMDADMTVVRKVALLAK